MRSEDRRWTPRWLAVVLVWLIVLGSSALAQAGVTLTLSANRADVGIGVGATYSISPNAGNPQGFVLDWGDGTTEQLQRASSTIVHAYFTPGVYTVAIRNDGAPYASAVVTIVDQTNCTIAAAPSATTVGTNVTFTVDVTGSARSTYALEFGDGDTAPPFTVGRQRSFQFTHAFRSPGVFFPVVRDQRGEAVLCRTTVTVTSPTATLTVTPTSVTVGEKVSASMGNLFAGVDYILDWGDDTTTPISVAASPSTAAAEHAYQTVGTFVVRLTSSGSAPLTATVVVRPPAPSLTVSPNPAAVGETVTAALGSLVRGVSYTLDWGNGTTVPVNATGSSTTLTQVFQQPGTYVVRLTAEGLPPVVSTLTVRLPAPSLAVSPNPAAVGETVTATLGSLVRGVAYTLDWGDGTTVPVTASAGSTILTRVFGQPGVYVVRLSADGVAPVVSTLTVRVPTPTLTPRPNPAAVGETVTATLGNLVQGVAYTLDWGDDATSNVTGNGTATSTHVYRAPGTYVVRLSAEGVAPVIVTLAVRLPTPTLSVAPNPAVVGQDVTATLAGTVASYPYRLDWGDDTIDAVTGGGPAPRHRYTRPGLYVVQLTAEGLAAPVTATVRVTPSLVVQSFTLSFVNPQGRPAPVVAKGARVDAALTLQYSGQGQLQGDVLLDGTPIARAVLNAPLGRSSVVFPVPNLPTDKVGTFTLSYQPDPAPGETPILPTPAAIVYRVREVPTEMDVGGFIFKLGVVTNLDPDAFAGAATHTLVVGGVEAFKDVGVNFTGLKVQDVSETRVKVTDGTVTMDLARFDTTPLPAGVTGFTLKPTRAVFAPTGARFTGNVILRFACTSPSGSRLDPGLIDRLKDVNFSRRLALAGVLPKPTPPEPLGGYQLMSYRPGRGQDQRFATSLRDASPVSDVSTVIAGLKQAAQSCRPDPSASYTVTDASLAPDTGDLFGETSATLNGLPVPSTPLTLTGTANLVLDLSAARSDAAVDEVRALYLAVPSEPAPPGGAEWTGVVLRGVTPKLGGASAAPTTATLRRGWTFAGDVAAGSFTDRGWTFRLSAASVKVVENVPATTDIAATTRVPLWEQDAPVTMTLGSDGVRYTIEGDVTRDFGTTILNAGSGAWTERGDALDLVMNSSTWSIGDLSTLQPRTRPSLGKRKRFDGATAFGNVSRGGTTANLALANFATSSAPRLTSFALGSRELQPVSLSPVQTQGGAGGAAGAPSPASGYALTARSGLSAALQTDLETFYGTRVTDGNAPLGSIELRVDGSARFQGRAPDAEGLSRTPAWGGDFKLFGQPFDIDYVVLGGAGGAYTLGLDGKQQFSPVVRAVSARARYIVSEGRERSFVLRTDGFSQYVNANTTFRVEGNEQRVVLGGRNVRVLAAMQGGGDVTIAKVDGGYELFLKGGLDMGRGNSAFSVTAEALFGLTSDPYFYVKASVDSRAPIVSVLGAFNIYGFTGGVAYRMRWPDRATVPQYAQRPAKSLGSGIQVIGGLTGAFEDGNSLHFRSIFSVDARGFQLTADGWILTPLSRGVFGREAPQSRILATITGDGFDMYGCLGPYPVDGISCGDLRAFTLYDVVTFTSWMHVRVADQKFVKIGTYAQPSKATLQIPALGGVTSTSYFIFGQAFEPGDLPFRFTGTGLLVERSTGLFVGYGFTARFGVAGALGKLGSPFDCYPWARASFDSALDANAGLVLDPVSFKAGVKFEYGFEVRAGCAGRDRPFANKQEIMEWNGKSFGVHLQATVEGTLSAYDPIAFSGSAALTVDLPLIPTFTVSAGASF
ncbi:PKD domain-containing protein [Deinococcus yavapaiensis]|uniref:PKD repeat protein n=1 Tax=Deinococcus yavapaiensis KR-236 TaxID=694435 RepID=A0A318S9G0_9DEIO|nr:PKD domain-containing protein [Deinococcus yavapaiensis]PYE54858.1 PKD repeat protein [Deinococcus yavapaiensis KR-236]